MEQRVKKLRTNSRFKKINENKDKPIPDKRFEIVGSNSSFFKKPLFDKRGNAINLSYSSEEVQDDLDFKSESMPVDFPKTFDVEDTNDEHEIDADSLDLDLDDRERSETISSSRLVVNYMDWDNIGAADIFVLLTAFCDKKDILSVKIYLSDYGRREIDHEVLHGPSVEPNKTLSFKQYYLKKRKHQFCVVQFVSSDVATKVYNLADGFEIENTSLTFDLSFVPDETTFDNRLLSECLEFPTNYTPHHFIVKALQQTNVEFEWDETDSRRLEITHKSVFREEDIVDIEKFDEFLAPPSDEDDIDKYRALLENDDAEISSETDGESGENSEYSQAPITCDQIDVPKSFKDPFLTTKPQKTKLKIEVSNLKEKNESELDLLMFDPEEPEDKHFDYAQIVKNKKTKRKSKNSKTIEEQCDDFNVNVDDKRFSALFKSSEYAIDPSSKLYKKTKNMESVLKLQTVRRKKFE